MCSGRWLTADANIQFWPKGLGGRKAEQGWVRKAGQPSEEKLEEGSGGANQAAGRQEIFKRDTKRMQLRPSKIQAQGLGGPSITLCVCVGGKGVIGGEL